MGLFWTAKKVTKENEHFFVEKISFQLKSILRNIFLLRVVLSW